MRGAFTVTVVYLVLAEDEDDATAVVAQQAFGAPSRTNGEVLGAANIYVRQAPSLDSVP